MGTRIQHEPSCHPHPHPYLMYHDLLCDLGQSPQFSQKSKRGGRGGWLKIKDLHSLALRNGSNWTSGYLPSWSVGMEPLVSLSSSQHACCLPPSSSCGAKGPKTQTTFRLQRSPVVDMPGLLHSASAMGMQQNPVLDNHRMSCVTEFSHPGMHAASYNIPGFPVGPASAYNASHD